MKHIIAETILTPNGWRHNVQVAIGPDGRIDHVGPVRDQSATRVALLLPAPGNLHSHSFQRAMAGLAETRGDDPGDSFWTWRSLMYRFLDQLTPEHVEVIAALSFVEMLETGFGSVGEFHYLHHMVTGESYSSASEMSARILAAASRVGIGITLLPVFYQFGGCDKRPPTKGQLRFSNDIERFATMYLETRKLVEEAPRDFGLGVAPHSLRAVEPAKLGELIGLADGGPIHIHVAEQLREITEFYSIHGARPVEWLLGNHEIDARWCLVHATHMTPGETAALAKTGAVAGLCPITEANLGDGVFRAEEYRQSGGVFGVGTDSNVEISLFGELRMLEYSQRLTTQCRAVLADSEHSTGRVLFEAAVRGGSQALGRKSGGIEAGNWADMIALDVDNQWLAGRKGDSLLDSLIFLGHGQSAITDVWSAGRHVVKEGRHFLRKAVVEEFKHVVVELGRDF